jgi:NAD(P)-dependent dehydrogenase (short-subunit alcohol dehydrogenase family)
MKNMRFANKVAVVTGAAVGIGRATVLKLVSEGARVAALDLDGEGLEKLKKEADGRILALCCNVADEAAVKAAFGQIRAELGEVNILVNNAGIWRDWASFMELSVDAWKKYIDVNLMSAVYCTREVLPAMLAAKYGRIINVASVAGVYGNANMVHYSATKGAMIAMTHALAKEVSAEGVLVNSVSPGSVSSSSHPELDYTSESALSFMGRTGSTMENANLICFLASDEASYVAGQNIQIDGCRKKQ